MMNFLAHLHLAGVRVGGDTSGDGAGVPWQMPCGLTLVGNLLPDLVRGRYRKEMPDAMAAGYRRHVCVDAWTDVSQGFLRGRARIRDHLLGETRRFSGVAVDVVFDHCLALSWSRWCPLPLPDFEAEVYRRIRWALESVPAVVPHAVASTLRQFAAEGWLRAYTSEAGLTDTLERMSRRYSRRFDRAIDLAPVMDAFRQERLALRSLFAMLYENLIDRLVAAEDGPAAAVKPSA